MSIVHVSAHVVASPLTRLLYQTESFKSMRGEPIAISSSTHRSTSLLVPRYLGLAMANKIYKPTDVPFAQGTLRASYSRPMAHHDTDWALPSRFDATRPVSACPAPTASPSPSNARSPRRSVRRHRERARTPTGEISRPGFLH